MLNRHAQSTVADPIIPALTTKDWLAGRVPFFYGYVMLPLVMLMQIGSSPGQTFSVSAFTPALLSSLGVSEASLAAAYMIATLAAAVPLFVVGPAADRFGMRPVCLIVVGCLSAACWFASTANGLLTIGAAFFLLRLLGQGSLSLLAGNTTSMWFRSRIGRVSALISVGGAVAFAFVPESLAALIEAVGWRSAYQTLAVVLAVGLLPPMWLLYRNRPEDVGQTLDGLPPGPRLSEGLAPTAAATETSVTFAVAASTKSFWIVAVANTLWAMAGTGIVFYLFTLASDRELADGTVAVTFRFFGFAMLAGQLVGGVLADFQPLHRLLGGGSTLLVAGLSVLLIHNAAAMSFFAILFGLGQGLMIAVSGVLWVRYYGRSHLGKIRGTVWCATVAGSGIGPLLMGLAKDLMGSYDPAIAAMALLLIPPAVASYWICPPSSTGEGFELA